MLKRVELTKKRELTSMQRTTFKGPQNVLLKPKDTRLFWNCLKRKSKKLCNEPILIFNFLPSKVCLSLSMNIIEQKWETNLDTFSWNKTWIEIFVVVAQKCFESQCLLLALKQCCSCCDKKSLSRQSAIMSVPSRMKYGLRELQA